MARKKDWVSPARKHMTLRGSKHRNVRVKVDGMTMDSKGEARRYQELKLLQQAGEISGLRRQVPFALHAVDRKTGRPKKVGEYRADFVYLRAIAAGDGDPVAVVEDFKGAPLTAMYRWKRKHMLIEHGITILETRERPLKKRKARR
ncbi:MAG: DUF1064 domain-containing protein [Phycisphaerae bacterium]